MKINLFNLEGDSGISLTIGLINFVDMASPESSQGFFPLWNMYLTKPSEVLAISRSPSSIDTSSPVIMDQCVVLWDAQVVQTSLDYNVTGLIYPQEETGNNVFLPVTWNWNFLFLLLSEKEHIYLKSKSISELPFVPTTEEAYNNVHRNIV